MKPIEILYQDEEIFVINKPSGLAVQGGKGVTHSVDRDLPQQVGVPVYLVHRLDKDTAGLMVVAKSPAAASKWIKLVGSGEVKKVYEAVCIGRISPEKGVIRESLIQHGVVREAVTHYEVVKKWTVNVRAEIAGESISAEGAKSSDSNDNGDRTNKDKCANKGDREKSSQAAAIPVIPMQKIRLKLETGRMHQIRIHLAGKGCFIAGDDKHGDFKVNKLLKKSCGIKKLLLASISLEIPICGERKVFTIPLPEYFPPESR